MTPELLEKYDTRIPRYTSYPTANHFHHGVGRDVHDHWLRRLEPGSSISLYLHVPFCTSLCWYCGCNTRAVGHYRPVHAYAAVLEHEIRLLSDIVGHRLPVSHIHWGGGTPNMLSAADLASLFETLQSCFEIRADAEVAIELDPRNLSESWVAALAGCGVTRASLGVQDFQPEVQRVINRIQPYEVTAQAVEWLRAAGIAGINLDLMYGLPLQTVDSVADTVEQALSLRPDRIALFGYAHVPWMKRHQRLLPEDALPGTLARFSQQRIAGERLVAHGWKRIGLDHFARPKDPLARALETGTLHRNFQGYTTDNATTLIGLGASAISALPGGYVQNDPSVLRYRAAIEDGTLATARGIAVGDDDRFRGEIIERLMCDLAVDLDHVLRRHGRDPASLDPEIAAIDRLVADGIARRCGPKIEVTDVGRPLLRAVCAVFDQYLQQQTDRHARAV